MQPRKLTRRDISLGGSGNKLQHEEEDEEEAVEAAIIHVARLPRTTRREGQGTTKPISRAMKFDSARA